LADGGTIFLDEVGDMSPFMEAKLLRVLQDGEIQKIGARTSRKVNVRVIAATNIDLRAEVRKGEFRKDLYYRLEGISVKIPPLRNRPGDIDLLINHYLPLVAAKSGKSVKGIDSEVRFYLNQYDWPGNVRELLNVIEGAVCLASQPIITWKDIPPHFAERIIGSALSGNLPRGEKDGPCKSRIPLHLAEKGPGSLEQLEIAAIERALNSTHGNKRRAALLLGMARSTFYEKLKRYRVPPCGQDIASSG
jgi:transcriptional regulator with PAS, ATPase and Fis domain